MCNTYFNCLSSLLLQSTEIREFWRACVPFFTSWAKGVMSYANEVVVPLVVLQ